MKYNKRITCFKLALSLVLILCDCLVESSEVPVVAVLMLANIYSLTSPLETESEREEEHLVVSWFLSTVQLLFQSLSV